MRHDIEFDSAGTTLRGWLYAPDGRPGPHPTVVVTHGYGAVKEQYTDDIAEALAASGLAVLLYDHPSFGASDGEPRQEVDPWAQIRGYRDAITESLRLARPGDVVLVLYESLAPVRRPFEI